MSGGCDAATVIRVAEVYGASDDDLPYILAACQELTEGNYDGITYRSGDEQPPPPKFVGGKWVAADELELEEYIGEMPMAGNPDRSDTSANCMWEIPEAVLQQVATYPWILAWHLQLGKHLSILDLFEEINVPPAAFLSPEELDEIAFRLVGRPLFATPEYFRPLVEYFGRAVMLENWLR